MNRAKFTDFLALASLALFALLLRLPAYDGRPFWADEGWRVMLALDPRYFHDYFFAPSVESAITSPIYAALLKAAAWFAISPKILRLSSLLPGIAGVSLMFALVRKAGGSVPLALLAGIIVAANENFIAYSNEMKPYMFEACIHLACLYAWLTLMLANRITPQMLAILFGTLALALLAAPNAIFLLPACAATLGARLFAETDRRGVAVAVAGIGSLALLALGLYFIAWRHGASGDMLIFWAPGFAAPDQNYAEFLGTALAAIWHASFNIFLHWPVPFLSIVALAAISATLILTRAVSRGVLPYLLLFYAVFFAGLFAANWMRAWPLGALRPDLFLYAHMIFILFFLASRTPGSRAIAALVLAAGMLALLGGTISAAGRAHFEKDLAGLANLGPLMERSDLVIRDFSSAGPVGQKIAADCRQNKSVILTDGFMSLAMRYYSRYDSAHHDWAASLRNCARFMIFTEDFSASRIATSPDLRSLMGKERSAWVMYSHIDKNEVDALQAVAAREGLITERHIFDGAGYFRLTARN